MLLSLLGLLLPQHLVAVALVWMLVAGGLAHLDNRQLNMN